MDASIRHAIGGMAALPRPGPDRSVGIVIRAGTKRLSIGELASSDSLEASTSLMLSLVRLALPNLK
jgi:hypothetical protein